MQSSTSTSSYKWALYASGLVFFLFTLGVLAQVNVIHSNQIFVVSTGWQDKTSRIPTKHPDKSPIIEKKPSTATSLIIDTDPEESTKTPATQFATDDESEIKSKSKDSIASSEIKSSTTSTAIIEDTDPMEVMKTSSSQSASDDESEISSTTQNNNHKSSNSSSSSSSAASRLLPYEYSASVAYQLDSMHSSNVKSALRTVSTTINTLQSSSSSASAPISTYLNKGNKIPIVLLTCNRPELLEQTINSLLQVKGVVKSNILISQDGSIKEVSDIAKKHGFALVQNTAGLKLRGAAAVDGSVTIAKHYKFSLDKAFETFPLAPAVIIIEDDLLFSPDFLDYFESVSPIIDVDKSVMLISSWNDNGFKQRVKNPWGLLRTEFFPGLGWLLPRKLYETELQSTWPTEHWDHWLRSPLRHKGRNIVYPEIPRTYHNGIKGTFMNMDTHNKYFKDIGYNNDATVSWSLPPHNQQINLPLLPTTTTIDTDSTTNTDITSSIQDSNNNEVVIKGVRKKKRLKLPLYTQAVEAVYDARIVDMISKCVHVNNVQDILTETPGLFCLWIDVAPDGSGYGNSPPFEPILNFFHLWHEFQRGARRGVHEFHWQSGSYILLLNIHNSNTFNTDTSNSNNNRRGGSFKYLFDSNTMRVIEPRMFDKRLLMEMTRKKIGLVGTAAESVNMNCHQVCASHAKSCRSDLLSLLNNCASLNAAFPCKDCHSSYGTDQPAYVALNADVQYHPGSCFYNSHDDVSNCESSHIATKRLCACS